MLEVKHNLSPDSETDERGRVVGPAGVLIAGILDRIEETHDLIDHGEPLKVTDVHQSRKNLKKIRAGIRLLSDADGLDLSEANRLCRDVGRLLSELRDTDVCLMTLEEIDPGLTRFAGLAEKLRSRRLALHEQRLPDDGARREVLADLTRVASLLGAIRHTHITARDLSTALEKTRDRAARRYAALDTDGSPEAFHDFRKAAKREYYQAGFLADCDEHDGRLGQLDRLGECLGQNQDLVVLGEVALDFGELDPSLAAVISERGADLREECERLARSLYGRGR